MVQYRRRHHRRHYYQYQYQYDCTTSIRSHFGSIPILSLAHAAAREDIPWGGTQVPAWYVLLNSLD